MSHAEHTRPRRARPTRDDVPDKVVATGQVNLGRRMRLEQHLDGAASTAFRFGEALPDDGLLQPFESPFPAANPGEVPVQELRYELTEAGEDLNLSGSGLVLSYGIFG